VLFGAERTLPRGHSNMCFIVEAVYGEMLVVEGVVFTFHKPPA
jgi:hypothetical protein